MCLLGTHGKENCGRKALDEKGFWSSEGRGLKLFWQLVNTGKCQTFQNIFSPREERGLVTRVPALTKEGCDAQIEQL